MGLLTEYTLMNKNTPVLDLRFCYKRGGYIEDIIKLHNPEYAPLGLVGDDKHIDTDSLSDWWEDRCLPDSRLNVERILEALQLRKQELILQSLGLSLSDQYWLKPLNSDLQWQDVNFFHNDFSDKVGKLFFSGQTSPADRQSIRQSYSPDYSANGFLNKYWTIEAGERVLLKGSFGPFTQQAYNEVIASEILRSLDCDHYVTYYLQGENSLCKNFINDHTEYIPASLIRRRLPPKEGETYWRHFHRCCQVLGFAESMQQALDYILPFDYLIANEDRNFGNFGVIRDVETLKILGVAPIFDNGNSLWYNQLDISNTGVKAYPFELDQEKQIKLVHNKAIFPINKVSRLADIIQRVLSNNKNCPPERIEKICQAVDQRRENLKILLS